MSRSYNFGTCTINIPDGMRVRCLQHRWESRGSSVVVDRNPGGTDSTGDQHYNLERCSFCGAERRSGVFFMSGASTSTD